MSILRKTVFRRIGTLLLSLFIVIGMTGLSAQAADIRRSTGATIDFTKLTKLPSKVVQILDKNKQPILNMEVTIYYGAGDVLVANGVTKSDGKMIWNTAYAGDYSVILSTPQIGNTPSKTERAWFTLSGFEVSNKIVITLTEDSFQKALANDINRTEFLLQDNAKNPYRNIWCDIVKGTEKGPNVTIYDDNKTKVYDYAASGGYTDDNGVLKTTIKEKTSGYYYIIATSEDGKKQAIFDFKFQNQDTVHKFRFSTDDFWINK